MNMKAAVIDIGGTAIKSGIFDSETKQITHKNVTPSEAQKGGARVMEIAQNIIAGYSGFVAIGISTTGQVDSTRGVIIYAGETAPEYTGMEVGDIFTQRFGVPVFVDNDVNAAAVGEAAYGAGVGEPNFLCLTYGTGVGGAIVLDGKVHTGASFSAGEVGIMVTHAGNPKGIFYEQHAAASILVRDMREAIPHINSGKKIFANIHVPEVKTMVDAWIGDIMCGLASLVHIFNPSLMVLGGGIMQADYIIPQIRARLNDYVDPGMRDVKIVPAALGNDAGMYGVGHIACEK